MPLLVKTTLLHKPIKGICLIADEDIKEGQLVYKDDRAFERVFTREQVEKMSQLLQDFIYKYAVYVKSEDIYYLDCDNARFFNHSNNPNCYYDGKTEDMRASRDIAKGEEMTSNYAEFCDNHLTDPGFTIIED